MATVCTPHCAAPREGSTAGLDYGIRGMRQPISLIENGISRWHEAGNPCYAAACQGNSWLNCSWAVRYFFATCIALISTQALACPDFLGKWESSDELSRAFNDNHAVIEERTKEFRAQIIGRSTMTYTSERVTLEMESVDSVTINGQTFPWDSSPMSGPYTVLGCTDDIVVLKVNYSGIELINSLNFESPDTYWIYEGTPKGTGNQHTREYFVRAN